jgi:hypothetical protein
MQGSDAPEFASVPLTVTGEDLDVVSVRLTAGHQMSGRVIVEGAESDPRMLDALRVSVMPGIGGMSAAMLAAHAPAADDGSFQVRGLMGRRFVRVNGLPGGWALKSVRAGGLDVTDEGIDILENVDGVEVVVTAAPTHLSGVVTDAAGALVPDAAVVIFPEARERRRDPHNRYVTAVRTGADGRFDVRALPPVAYFAVAVHHLQDGEWAEPDNLDRLAAVATRVMLPEGSSRTVALRVREE